MASHWNIQRLFSDIISNRDACLQWCEEHGLLPTRRMCCEGHEMYTVLGKTNLGQFRCSKKHSSGKTITLSRTRGSVFEGKRVSPEKVLIMIYCFAHDLTYHDCIIESSIDGGTTSKETVSEFYTFFRELITQHYLEFESFDKIGGKDKAVEILEFFLNQQKFKIGSYEEDLCIAVMVELETKHFCVEICHENKWNNENLSPLIKKNLLEGSTIICKDSKAYSVLADDGYVIQNSKDYVLSFKIPDYTDSGLNNSPKEFLHHKKYAIHKDFGVDKLLEFLYKCRVKENQMDPFEAFLDIIRCRFKL